MGDATPEQLFEQGMEQVSALAAALSHPPHVTLTTAVELIEAAIAHGALIYNEGDHQRCYRLYAETAGRIVAAGERGMGRRGRKTLGMLDDLTRAMTRAAGKERASDAAWVMRHAFDKVLLTRQLQMETLHMMMSLGESAFMRSDYGGAADAFAAAVEVAPELYAEPDPDADGIQAAHLAYLYYGHTLILEGRALEAAPVLAEGITRIPQMCSLDFDLRSLGPHYAAFEQRRRWLEDISPTDPAASVAPLLRAYLLVFSGERKQAADVLRVYLSGNPQDEAAQILLAMTPQCLMD
jgi:tetratricopeptide (TPR) repeat protein